MAEGSIDALKLKQMDQQNSDLKKEVDEVYRLLGEKDSLLHECKNRVAVELSAYITRRS